MNDVNDVNSQLFRLGVGDSRGGASVLNARTGPRASATGACTRPQLSRYKERTEAAARRSLMTADTLDSFPSLRR